MLVALIKKKHAMKICKGRIFCFQEILQISLVAIRV